MARPQSARNVVAYLVVALPDSTRRRRKIRYALKIVETHSIPQIHLNMQRSFVPSISVAAPRIIRSNIRTRALPPSIASLFSKNIVDIIHTLKNPDDVFEVTMDLGKPPSIRRLVEGDIPISMYPVTREDLDTVLRHTGAIDSKNRTGIDGTLHRISAILNAKNEIAGLTVRIGRDVHGIAFPLHKTLKTDDSLLIVGKPGSGKTSLLRDIARTLSDDYKKRVIIVDKSGEIGGNGTIAHESIGSARRLVVPRGSSQHDVMIEAVENHTPDVIIVDEISTILETRACQTINERGIRLIATAHGLNHKSIVNNPTLNTLVGGVEAVTVGDISAKSRGGRKIVSERKGNATFTKIVEITENRKFEVHDTLSVVDAYLKSM